jgi:hypothetical protein
VRILEISVAAHNDSHAFLMPPAVGQTLLRSHLVQAVWVMAAEIKLHEAQCGLGKSGKER